MFESVKFPYQLSILPAKIGKPLKRIGEQELHSHFASKVNEKGCVRSDIVRSQKILSGNNYLILIKNH